MKVYKIIKDIPFGVGAYPKQTLKDGDITFKEPISIKCNFCKKKLAEECNKNYIYCKEESIDKDFLAVYCKNEKKTKNHMNYGDYILNNIYKVIELEDFYDEMEIICSKSGFRTTTYIELKGKNTGKEYQMLPSEVFNMLLTGANVKNKVIKGIWNLKRIAGNISLTYISEK